MNKYLNSKIYAVRNTLDEDIYVGSTTMKLCQRMIKHRCAANTRPSNQKINKKMNELGINNFYIELIENFPCDNIEQLRKREGEVIRQLGTLNMRVERRTHKEWREENKEHLKKKYEENRNEILKKKKEKYEENRDEILQKKRECYNSNKEIAYERAK